MKALIHVFTSAGLRNLCLAIGPHQRMNLSGQYEEVWSHAYPRATIVKVPNTTPDQYSGIVVGHNSTERIVAVPESDFCQKCLLVFNAMQANGEKSPRNMRRLLKREGK